MLTRPFDESASRFLVIALSAYFVVLALLFLTTLLLIWPGMARISRIAALPKDVRLLLIAVSAAGLGSVINAATSFVNFVAERRLVKSWGIWYLFRPLIGLTTGLVVYAALRGGILKADAAVDALNPYTVVTITALAGFLSKYIVDKLNDYAQERFKTKAQVPHRDRLSLPLPNIEQIDPAVGPPSGGTAVTITGDNFVRGTKVFFGDSPSISTSVDTDGRKISTVTPPGEGTVDVQVANPDNQSVAWPSAFTYE